MCGIFKKICILLLGINLYWSFRNSLSVMMGWIWHACHLHYDVCIVNSGYIIICPLVNKAASVNDTVADFCLDLFDLSETRIILFTFLQLSLMLVTLLPAIQCDTCRMQTKRSYTFIFLLSSLSTALIPCNAACSHSMHGFLTMVSLSIHPNLMRFFSLLINDGSH